MVFEGKVLDGRNRLAACKIAGVKPHINVIQGRNACWNGRQRCTPTEYVISLNLHRRHLTAEQKREVIAALLKANPKRSNRQVAEQVKADDKTVGKVRRELEATAEIPQLEKTEGKDGKERTTARKPTKAER